MLKTQNRRDFFKTSALAGVGLGFVGGWISPWASSAAPTFTYGSLSSIAIADDGARIARHAGGMASVIKESIYVDLDEDDLVTNSVLLGGHLPGDAPQVIDLLEETRAKWTEEEEHRSYHQEVLALIAGWIFHQSLAERLEPALRGLNDTEVRAARLHQDAAILRARSAGAAAQATEEEVTSLFMEMLPRTLIRYHTMIPDDDDTEAWILRMIEWRVETAERFREYAAAFVNPDPAMVRRYVSQPNFYGSDDDVVQVAARLRRQEDAPRTSTEVDLDTLRGGSVYGDALVAGLKRLRAAAAFFDQDLDRAELSRHLVSQSG